MVRAMWGQKVVDRKTTVLGLKETIDQLATANGFRMHGHALNLEVSGNRKRGRPKKNGKKQVEKTEKVGFKKEDALNRDK